MIENRSSNAGLIPGWDSTCLRATKPTCMLQREKTTHHNEDPTCCNYDMVLPNKYNFFFNFRKGEQITDTDNNMVESQNHYAM